MSTGAHWFFLAYGAALFYLLVRPERRGNAAIFHQACYFYLAGICAFAVFALIFWAGATEDLAPAGDSARAVVLAREGVIWLDLFISASLLLRSYFPSKKDATSPGDEADA